jgi:hypothetical protein
MPSLCRRAAVRRPCSAAATRSCAALRREARHVRIAARGAGVELSGRLPMLALREAVATAVRRVLGDVPIWLKLH